ncbi:MAG: hypothetical protein IPG45_22600 [Deltaproteobacteria bacterium]|jgi:hypothetical protein|nr:hypothetical protein [Deltaproteobacteria bacterium]
MKSLIPSQWQVPQVFHERLGQRYGRARAMTHEGHLLLILYRVPSTDATERSGLLFWRTPNGEWKSTDGSGIAHLRTLVESYGHLVEALEAKVDAATVAQQFYDVLKLANPLKRSATQLHQTLQSARESIPNDRDLIDLRDAAGDTARAAELINDEARIGLDFETASASEEQNRLSSRLARASQRLNMIAAIFLPLTAIASVFGMNVPSGLEALHQPIFFWIILAFGLAWGFILRGQVHGDATR